MHRDSNTMLFAMFVAKVHVNTRVHNSRYVSLAAKWKSVNCGVKEIITQRIVRYIPNRVQRKKEYLTVSINNTQWPRPKHNSFPVIYKNEDECLKY